MRIYKKLIPESIRVLIRNIQFKFDHACYLLNKYLFSKSSEKKVFKTKKNNVIAYLIPTSKITGGVAVVCEHVNRLKNRGYNTLLISYDNKTDLSWFPNQNVEVIPLKGYKEYIEKNITHLVATGWITAYTLDLLQIPNKYYFVQSDERKFYPDRSFLRKRVNLTYTFPYKYFTEAKWIKTWLKDEFNQQSSLVPNGVNTDIFYKVDPIEKLPKNRPRILLEGAINLPFKGMEKAFEVTKELDAEIWCVSNDGRPQPHWKCDRFFENVPMNKMKEIYSSCDYLLKLSSVEGVFGPPVEMIACGGVPIVNSVSGATEVLKDGYNAYFLNGKSPNEIQKEIQHLLKNKELIQKIKDGRKQTLARLSWDVSIDLLEKLLFS